MYRQLPLLTHFIKEGHRVMVFAYGSSLAYLKSNFADTLNLEIAEVTVPYYWGGPQGLDFWRSAANAPLTDGSVNMKAMAQAWDWLGKPDLVLSDYEPVSAQYAYAKNAKLITLDQQSKYLLDGYHSQLGGTTYLDEVERLRMFFPKAALRVACSFFKVPSSSEEVVLVAPIIRESVKNMRRSPKQGHYVVYLTAQSGFTQSADEMLVELGKSKGVFEVFLPKSTVTGQIPENVNRHDHGSPLFDRCLKECEGLISTAGHSLLSEAMHLGIPVLALPLPLYEQQLNAHILAENRFGMSSPTFDTKKFNQFKENTAEFTRNIAADLKVLLRGDGLATVQNLLGI